MLSVDDARFVFDLSSIEQIKIRKRDSKMKNLSGKKSENGFLIVEPKGE